MKILKKNILVLLLAVLVATASCSFTTKEFNDPDKDKLLIDLITYVLQKGHYSPKDMNDMFSENVYEDFIDRMDPLKRFFLASDIEEFEQYKFKIDDQIKVKDLSFFNLVYSRYMKRMEEVKTIYPTILDVPFDYTIAESINVDYENTPYVNNEKELKERWRKQLKFSTISNYYDTIEENENKPKDLENEFEGDAKTIALEEPKSLKEIEIVVRESSKKSLDEYFDFTDDLERKDYFAIFLTTIVEEYDPHTNYFAPPDRDRFDLRMSGKLKGIGARLQKRNDYVKVVEVISGGPAWRGRAGRRRGSMLALGILCKGTHGHSVGCARVRGPL